MRFIRDARDLIARIEERPESAAKIAGMDPWERWWLRHGMAVLVNAELSLWEIACLRCIVRHSGVEERIPQRWLFDGGPDRDPALTVPRLSDDARRRRITRFRKKLAHLRVELGLDWKLERAVDCTKTIYTACSPIITGPSFRPPKHR